MLRFYLMKTERELFFQAWLSLDLVGTVDLAGTEDCEHRAVTFTRGWVKEQKRMTIEGERFRLVEAD